MTKEQLGRLILDSEQQLYATAKTMLASDNDCADVIQETIVKAFAKMDMLKEPQYARTWLIRILINECYTFLRKSGKVIYLDDLGQKEEPATVEEKDYSDLYQAVRTLKEELRVPVVLYYMEEFSIREVAQVLEISEGAVQKRLARVRAKLKMYLQESEAQL